MWGTRTVVAAALIASLGGCSWFGGGKKPPVRPGKQQKDVLPATKYEVELQLAVEPPSGSARLQLWVPLPPESALQDERDRRVVPAPRYRWRKTTDSAENPLLAWSVEQPRALRLSIYLTIDRRPARMRLNPARTRQITQADRLDHRAWLAEGKGVPVDDRMRDLTASIVGAETNALRQGRALFDWLARNIGWRESSGPSSGDGGKALDTLAGDGADLAALFVALCRSAGLPARTCRGVGWPAAPAGQPLVVSERWWAELWVPNLGWIPVDVEGEVRARASGGAEAETTATDLAGPHFGWLDGRRLVWARGRSLLLEPRQDAGPLDAVRGAYAEVDGKAVGVSAQLVVRVAKPKGKKKPAPPKKKKPAPPKKKPAPPKKKGKR